MLGGQVEDGPESPDCCEVENLGGVLPRWPAPTADFGVSGPRKDPLVSEEDRSLAGDLPNSRRNDAPMLEARLGRVCSLSKTMKLGSDLGSRTTPEDGTADNLSMSPSGLVASWDQSTSRGTNAEVGNDIVSDWELAIGLANRGSRDS